MTPARATAVAMGFVGSFVATWEDGTGGIVARRFDNGGSAVEPEFRASSAGTFGAAPDVAIGPSGQFALAWQQRAPALDWDVVLQRFARTGGTVGAPLRLNGYTTGDQTAPRLGFDASGAIVTVWQSDGQDGDGWGIFARRLDVGSQGTGTHAKIHVGIGPGPTPDNPPLSAEITFSGATGSFSTPVYSDGSGAAVAHYGTLTSGVNVGGGDITPSVDGEFLTGPGSVSVYGPHVRAWAPGGTPIAKVSFYAYGTLRYGVKPRGGQVDGDAFHEIVTGAGEGAVFGPHVRAFDFDGGALAAISRINYFAYNAATYSYGVNLEAGDTDGDGADELATGPAASAGYGSWLKLWHISSSSPVTMLAEQDPVYWSPNTHGVKVATGDLDGDGDGELLCGRGPGPLLDGYLRVFTYDAGLAQLDLRTEIATVAHGYHYGTNLASADIDGDGIAEIYGAPGPDPTAPLVVRSYAWPGPGSDLLAATALWDVAPFGVAAPNAAFGATLGRGFE